MKVSKIDNMVKGWFIGSFEPSVLKSENFESAVKYYNKGDYDNSHFHKIAKEITVIIKWS